MVRMDIKIGKIIWQTKMIPNNKGKTGAYLGAAIWESSPPIHKQRRHVYVATGNLYSVPPDIQACQEKQDNLTKSANPDRRFLPGDYSESILAIDLESGRIAWSSHFGEYDTFVLASIPKFNPNSGPDNCSKLLGPNNDFGNAQMMLTVPSQEKHSEWIDIVVAGQKSGFVWALDRNNCPSFGIRYVRLALAYPKS